MTQECADIKTGNRKHYRYTPADYGVTLSGVPIDVSMCRQCVLDTLRTVAGRTMRDIRVSRAITTVWDVDRHRDVRRMHEWLMSPVR